MRGELNVSSTFIPYTDADRALSDLDHYRKLGGLDPSGRIVEVYGINEEKHLTPMGHLANLPTHIDQMVDFASILPENAEVLLVTGDWIDSTGQSIDVDALEIDVGATAKSIREETAEILRDSEDFDRQWRNEIAMEAGMMGGLSAYNEVMGY